MASRIQGITVTIGGDTAGLNKALSGTNKSINATQSQLKDVERLLKLDPSNTQLLEQKQRLLSQAVSETKEKLDTLKEAEKQVQEQFERGEINQQQYDALQREILATENSLEELEKQAGNSNVAIAKISVTADKVAEGADKLAQKTKGLSMAAGGLLASMGAMAVKAGAAADDINTLAAQTGLSTDQIQKFQYAADLIDVSLETVTGSMTKMIRNMSSAQKGTKAAQEAFKTLGVAVTDSSGHLRDSNDVFNESINALGKIQNETERDAVAMQIFGKSARDLNPLILGGADALKELGEEAEAAGLILSQDALDSANEFNDAIDTLKWKAAGTFAKVGGEIATALLPFMEKLSDAISGVLEWLGGLNEGQLKFIGTILLVVAAISPMLSMIGKMSLGIKALSGLFGTLGKTVIPAVGKAFSFLAANPIVLVVGAIVGLIAIIAKFGDQILDVLNMVDDFLQNIFVKDWSKSFGVIGDLINAFMANVKNIWDGVKGIFEGIINFIRGVFTGDWSRAWEGLKQIVAGIFGTILGIVKAPINGIIGLINGVITGINWLIEKINDIDIQIPKWLGGGRIGGWNIPTIPKMDYLAKGGNLWSGMAIVGEAGPELLEMRGDHARITPLKGGSSNSYMGGETNVNIYVTNNDTTKNSRQVAEVYSREMQRAVERKGAVFANA